MSMQTIVSEEQIDKVGFLRRAPLFQGLPDETIARLAPLTRIAVFPEGAAIIEEGEEIDEEAGDGMYLLISGAAEVRKDATDATDGRLLARLGPGDFFGEMALLDSRPRSASVFATEESQCLSLNRWDFLRELRRNPDIAVKMLEVLSGRLRIQNEAQGRPE